MEGRARRTAIWEVALWDGTGRHISHLALLSRKLHNRIPFISAKPIQLKASLPRGRQNKRRASDMTVMKSHEIKIWEPTETRGFA